MGGREGAGGEAMLPVLRGKVWLLCQTTRRLCLKERGDEKRGRGENNEASSKF